MGIFLKESFISEWERHWNGSDDSIKYEIKNEIELIEVSEKIRKKLSTFWINTWVWFFEAIKWTYRRVKIELWKINKLQTSSDDFDKIIFSQFSKVFLSYLYIEWFSIIWNKKLVRDIYNDFREFVLTH